MRRGGGGGWGGSRESAERKSQSSRRRIFQGQSSNKRDDEKNQTWGELVCSSDGLEGVEPDGVAGGWWGFQCVRLTDGLIKAKCVSVRFHYVPAAICIASKIPLSR